MKTATFGLSLGLFLYAVAPSFLLAPPTEAKSGANEKLRQAEKAARAYFAAPQTERNSWKFDAGLDRLLAEDEAGVRRAVWEAYRKAPVHEEAKKDFAKNQVRSGKLLSPYTVKRVGRRPRNGWPLFIALHGGGGAPKAVNDSQWKIMQIYYRDQGSVPGYLYLALRAPNDTWNGFYEDGITPLVVNLVRQFLLLGDVDPNKVYLMGYSHGGYGAFFLGPKIPDRFAAVHASAAAPTDGAVSPRTLRHTRFTYMVGDRDTAYGRRERCEKFDREVQILRKENPGDYPVVLELKKGFGHGGLPDRDKIEEMYPHTRNPVPRHVTWALTDAVVKHFFWLSVPQPGKGQEIDATVRDNGVRITTRNVKEFDLDLDGRLVSFARPLRIWVDGREQELNVHPRFGDLCRSLGERGDPELAFTCRVRLRAGKR